MQIVCKDGTTFQCRDFEAIDSGVLFFQEERARVEADQEEEEEEEEEERRASGFVPIVELKYILPDEMVQPRGTQSAGVSEGVPADAQYRQDVGMTQQQQLQGAPGSAPPAPTSQQRPEQGRR